MPLEKGSGEEIISRNIATEIHAGKDPKQAAAIAYSTAKNDAEPIKASGIIYRAGSKVLLIQRASADEFNGHWELPAGHVEESETHADAAIRESTEEIGFTPDASALRPFGYKDEGSVQFATYVVRGDEFEPTLNHEHTAHQWVEADSLPSPMHPGAAADINRMIAPDLTETEIAERIRDGALSSPQHFENMWLWDMRITGTGTTYRRADDQMVYRPPEIYLNPEFLKRCNGLSVLLEHPPGGMLNSKEFAARIVGNILLPYIKGDEVWGIARIYDDLAANLMIERKLSTSPTVIFRNTEVNDTIALNDGSSLLIEGKPSLLDQLAICASGVWDKGGPPSGIISDTVENTEMPDPIVKTEADANTGAAPNLDPILNLLKNISAKQDSQGEAIAALQKSRAKSDDDEEKPTDDGAEVAADADETPEEKEAREAKAKADADELAEIKADAEEMRAGMKAMADAMPKPLTDADYNEMATVQAKADSVASAFGQRTPGPLMGETPLNYRKRVLAPFRVHSKDFATVDLAPINDAALLAVIEQRVYADAMDVAMNPTASVGGGLRELINTDSAGRRISTFVGDTAEWMAPFQSRSRKVMGWNKRQEL